MDETSSNRENPRRRFATGKTARLHHRPARRRPPWTIVGRSRVSKTYEGKEAFIEEVLQPFGARSPSGSVQ
jgi:hypothetical protein